MKQDVTMCYICEDARLCQRHYTKWICNSCYHLAQRIRTKTIKDTGFAPSITELLVMAFVRRHELKESGKWEKNEKFDRMQVGIRPGTRTPTTE